MFHKIKRCRVALCALVFWTLPLVAHELHGHQGPTYEITDPIRIEKGQPRLKISVLDRDTAKSTAARIWLKS